MEKFKVNPLSPDNWEQYKNLWLEALTNDPKAFANSYEKLSARTEEEWQEKATKYSGGTKEKVFIATSEGKAIGMMGFFEKSEGIANIFGVYVNPQYRGKGVSNVLMEVILKSLKQGSDFSKIELTVNKDQLAAVGFYKRHGFEIIGEIKDVKIGDGSNCDEYLMRREIK